MSSDVDYLQALRSCCSDDAAFAQLQQLLADSRSTQIESPEPSAPGEALLQAVYAELQEVRQLQAVLFHVMEHDLRPFLMGALMVLKNLLNQSSETIMMTRSRVKRMIQASDRHLGTISALLETYTTAEPTVALQPEPVEFSAISQSILQDLAPLLAANQANITPQISPNLPPVLVDTNQIQRVISYLVTASLQHNPPGLHLTLGAEVESGRMRCTLQDDGLGWEAEECDRFFELQVRSPHACCSTSVGVQLHLCQQLIQRHGGEIGVVNTNPGSLIWFTLPLAAAVTPTVNVPASRNASTQLAIAPQDNTATPGTRRYDFA